MAVSKPIQVRLDDAHRAALARIMDRHAVEDVSEMIRALIRQEDRRTGGILQQRPSMPSSTGVAEDLD